MVACVRRLRLHTKGERMRTRSSVQTLRAPTKCGATPGSWPLQAFVLFRAPHQRLRVLALLPPIRPDGFVVLLSRRGQRAAGPASRVPNSRFIHASRYRSDTNASYHNPGGADLCTTCTGLSFLHRSGDDHLRDHTLAF